MKQISAAKKLKKYIYIDNFRELL